MAKTKRRQPENQDAKRARYDRAWQREVDRFEAEKQAHAPKPQKAEAQSPVPSQPRQPTPPPTQDPPPAQIEALKAEAERALATTTNFSRQVPAPGQESQGRGLLWWTGGNIEDFIPLAEYGTHQRQYDLRDFALVAPMILIAESVLVKKMQALQWSVESGRNRAIQWQKTLAGLEQDRGWDTFIARWTRAYCESDYGGYAEIIRRVPRWAVDGMGSLTPRGEAALERGEDRSWPIVDARVMDPARCTPTADPEFPLLFFNSFTGKKHRLRPHQFMHILDMPNVDDRVPNQGTCAISRAVWAAQEDRMATRYGFEAMSENPGTGLILANVNQNALATALSSAEGERDARGVVYYKGVIFLPLLDPSGNVKLEYLTFSHLPENFNRTEDYSRIKEVVASAFGMDVLELGSIPGHNLGSGQQAVVAAAKARGKGIGALIQSVEREFRYKFLPADVQLRIKKHDIDEQADRAELDTMYFNMATQMVQVGAWDPVLANQYLADKGAIQPEFPYMAADLTPSEELEDTEATEDVRAQAPVEKRDGPKCRVHQDGRVEWTAHAFVYYAQKRLKQAKPTFPVDEEIGLRDLRAARELWRSHVPTYNDLIDADTTPREEEPKGLIKRLRRAMRSTVQAPSPTAVFQVQSPPPHVTVNVPKQEPADVTVHMPEQSIYVEVPKQVPPDVNVNVQPAEQPVYVTLPEQQAPVVHVKNEAPVVHVAPSELPDVLVSLDAPQFPITVNVPEQRPSDVTVKMDAPPINVNATLHSPDETIETETIVERDPRTRQITRTNKTSRKEGN